MTWELRKAYFLFHNYIIRILNSVITTIDQNESQAQLLLVNIQGHPERMDKSICLFLQLCTTSKYVKMSQDKGNFECS
jgi:hypothetical protein